MAGFWFFVNGQSQGEVKTGLGAPKEGLQSKRIDEGG